MIFRSTFQPPERSEESDGTHGAAGVLDSTGCHRLRLVDLRGRRQASEDGIHRRTPDERLPERLSPRARPGREVPAQASLRFSRTPLPPGAATSVVAPGGFA